MRIRIARPPEIDGRSHRADQDQVVELPGDGDSAGAGPIRPEARPLGVMRAGKREPWTLPPAG